MTKQNVNKSQRHYVVHETCLSQVRQIIICNYGCLTTETSPPLIPSLPHQTMHHVFITLAEKILLCIWNCNYWEKGPYAEVTPRCRWHFKTRSWHQLRRRETDKSHGFLLHRQYLKINTSCLPSSTYWSWVLRVTKVAATVTDNQSILTYYILHTASTRQTKQTSKIHLQLWFVDILWKIIATSSVWL